MGIHSVWALGQSLGTWAFLFQDCIDRSSAVWVLSPCPLLVSTLEGGIWSPSGPIVVVPEDFLNAARSKQE